MNIHAYSNMHTHACMQPSKSRIIIYYMQQITVVISADRLNTIDITMHINTQQIPGTNSVYHPVINSITKLAGKLLYVIMLSLC